MICKELLDTGMLVISAMENMPKRDIISKSRKQKLADTRHLFCLVMHNIGFDYVDIAEYINRNRTTIYNDIKKAKDIIYYDDAFKKKADVILKILKGEDNEGAEELLPYLKRQAN